MIVLVVLGYILLTILTILLLLLIMPVEYYAEGEKGENIFIKAGVKIFMGLIGFYYYKPFSQKGSVIITLLGIKKRIRTDQFMKKEKEEKEDKENKGSFSQYFEIEFIKKVVGCVRKVFSHIKPKRFEVKGRVGFEDPYNTGVLCTMLNIFQSGFDSAKISIEPVFDDEIFEGRGLIQGRIVLLYLAFLLIWLYLSRPVSIKHNKQKIKEENLYVS